MDMIYNNVAFNTPKSPSGDFLYLPIFELVIWTPLQMVNKLIFSQVSIPLNCWTPL